MNLNCNQLSKTYNKTFLALENVTLDIKPGICGLLGANGAGKTTLMQILTTILQPNKGGNVLYNGNDINNILKQYRSILGYVPQECGLPDYIKVKNLLLLISQFKEIKYKEAKKQIGELLEMLNLSDKENAYVKELSGGMKQRLSIAQAFLGNPEILILDEPTKGLDIYEQEHIYNFIRQYSNKIVLISSHIIQDIDSTCNSVIIIDKGKVLYSGLIIELIKSFEGKLNGTDFSNANENLSPLRDVYLNIIKSNKNLVL